MELPENGDISIRQGERLLIPKNDRKLGVKNGNLATVVAVGNEQLKVKLDSGRRSIGVAKVGNKLWHHYDSGFRAKQIYALANTPGAVVIINPRNTEEFERNVSEISGDYREIPIILAGVQTEENPNQDDIALWHHLSEKFDLSLVEVNLLEENGADNLANLLEMESDAPVLKRFGKYFDTEFDTIDELIIYASSHGIDAIVEQKMKTGSRELRTDMISLKESIESNRGIKYFFDKIKLMDANLITSAEQSPSFWWEFTV